MLHCGRNDMQEWSISTEGAQTLSFSEYNHRLVAISSFLEQPDCAIENAVLQKFAGITPQYPGLRAALDSEIADHWLDTLSPLLSRAFDAPEGRWSMVAWHSIVSHRPQDLLPIQRLPHVDGTDPNQVAMMLYLHRTGHGGTAFFRHKSTGLEALTEESFPRYRAALEREVRATGLPPAAYITDGAPLFERTYASAGEFNQAIFYRGNILHSGVIDNHAPLSCDPREGRYTINAFLRPPGGEGPNDG